MSEPTVMPNTPVPHGSEPNEITLEDQLMSQYRGLTDDIKNYYDQQEADFRSKSDVIPEDRIDYLITNKVGNLEGQRKAIWRTLQDEFNQNTKDKHLNAKMMVRNKKTLCSINANLKKKQAELKELQDQNQTSLRHVEGYLYHNKSTDHVIYVMQVSAVILLISSLLLALAQYGMISAQGAGYAFWGLLLVVLCFVIYQFYLSRPNQDHQDYDKYIYQSPPTTTDAPVPSDNIDYDTLDQKLDKEFDKYTKNKCQNAKKSPYESK
jgi:hypothetical protein